MNLKLLFVALFLAALVCEFKLGESFRRRRRFFRRRSYRRRIYRRRVFRRRYPYRRRCYCRRWGDAMDLDKLRELKEKDEGKYRDTLEQIRSELDNDEGSEIPDEDMEQLQAMLDELDDDSEKRDEDNQENELFNIE